MFFFPILIVALAAASVMNTHACQKGEKDFFLFLQHQHHQKQQNE
jgi:hypothetical protein